MIQEIIQPNIFDYATSELSQDAVICYLLSFGKKEFNGSKEYIAAHKFLRECGIEEDVKEIHTQYKHIDVLVETENYLLIIEDKTYTNEHDDQILHYVKELKNDELSQNREIRVCYFKTGDYLRKYVPPKNQDILLEKNCKSLERKDILEIIKDIQQDNLIFESFYSYWKTSDKNVCQDDVSTWTRAKWFEYLKECFEKYHINDNDKKWDINSYVPNASGGFYATHFNYNPCERDIEKFEGEEKKMAETYQQIELFFSDGRTSRINLAYRFHSNNWDREETKKYRADGILRDLQNRIDKEGYKNQNKMGASTAYKILSYGDNKRAFKPISKETTAEILKEIEEFIENPS